MRQKMEQSTPRSHCLGILNLSLLSEVFIICLFAGCAYYVPSLIRKLAEETPEAVTEKAHHQFTRKGYQHDAPIYQMSLSEDGKTLALLKAGGEIQIRHISSRTSSFWTPETFSSSSSCALSGCGRFLAIGHLQGSVEIVNISPEVEFFQENHAVCKHTNTVSACEFSPDNAYLASADVAGSLIIWDIEKRQVIHRMPHAHREPIQTIRFSRDNTQCVTASSDQTLRLWDMRSGSLLTTFTGHKDRVLDVAFIPHDDLIASAGMDGTVRIWSLQSFKEIRTITCDSKWIISVAILPETNRIICGDFMGDFHVSQLESGQILFKIRAHASGVKQLRRDATTGKLYSGGYDGYVNVWSRDLIPQDVNYEEDEYGDQILNDDYSL